MEHLRKRPVFRVFQRGFGVGVGAFFGRKIQLLGISEQLDFPLLEPAGNGRSLKNNQRFDYGQKGLAKTPSRRAGILAHPPTICAQIEGVEALRCG